jgi:hypothetical protein
MFLRMGSVYKSTRRYDTEEQHRRLRRRDNLKSHTSCGILIWLPEPLHVPTVLLLKEFPVKKVILPTTYVG